MPIFKDFDKNTFTVFCAFRAFAYAHNPKTNRVKTFRKAQYHITKITPEKRSLKNLPRYADGKSKITPQEWLGIKQERKDKAYGKSENGKWYGWSHRAIYGFKVGDKITGDNMGKKVSYPKLPDGNSDWDNGNYEDDFTIETEDQARQCAINFHEAVR